MYELEGDSYNRKHIDDESVDDRLESSSMKPEDEDNDDSLTYKRISDTDPNKRFEYIIGGVIIGVQEGAFLYSVILGLLFGFGANFNLFLLIGAYFDISLPIVIWLAGQTLFLLFVDLSLLAAAFYSANIFLIQSLKFGFNLYCLLVVRSHLHFLNQSVKSKSIQAV
ncbi:uncharacterized protein LOC120353518 [Nilaparvata lugens]|uniref:uncharacterized protein LOC120353518 n=1 Tax=Nilaparvata lugens TaxID=108931 RepID=UPI00193D1953|nr:uncharacterized protein LOC120353518 [Nilaparvata lugens]